MVYMIANETSLRQGPIDIEAYNYLTIGQLSKPTTFNNEQNPYTGTYLVKCVL